MPDPKIGHRAINTKAFSLLAALFLAVGIVVFLLAQVSGGVYQFLGRAIASPELIISIAPLLILLVVALYYLLAKIVK